MPGEDEQHLEACRPSPQSLDSGTPAVAQGTCARPAARAAWELELGELLVGPPIWPPLPVVQKLRHFSSAHSVSGNREFQSDRPNLIQQSTSCFGQTNFPSPTRPYSFPTWVLVVQEMGWRRRAGVCGCTAAPSSPLSAGSGCPGALRTEHCW